MDRRRPSIVSSTPMARGSLVTPMVLYTRATAFLRRWLDRSDRLTGAFMSAALSIEEKSDVSVRLYDASPVHRGTAMQPWEQAWLARRLPPAPSRILVGACGAGRELLPLTPAGYTVDAFEPAPSLAATARERTIGAARVLAFRYEELSAAVLDGAPNAAAELARERYDAVLLGWGSLAHVLDERERMRLMQALARLCPQGPWLASFLRDDLPDGRAHLGRVERWGARLGHTVAQLRRLPGTGSREIFLSHVGFGHLFTSSELEALAAHVGRQLQWDDDDTDYPHATFV
jgi:hypothetical protein